MIECYKLKYKITRHILSYDQDKNAKQNNLRTSTDLAIWH